MSHWGSSRKEKKGLRLLSRKLIVRDLCRRGWRGGERRRRGEKKKKATKPTFNIERRGKNERVSKCFEGMQLLGQSVLWVAMAFPS